MVKLNNPDGDAKKLIIVCDDVYGLDVLTIIDAINQHCMDANSIKYTVIGLISDNTNCFSKIISPVPFLGKISDWNCKPEASYVAAIRSPMKKQLAVEKLKLKGAVFETIIAPWVRLPSEFVVGEGCILANYKFKNKSRFGNFVIMDTAMCETVEIDDFSTLCPFVNITNAKIGKRVYVGTHSAIISNRKIGDDAVLLSGSIVLTDIKPGTTVAGVPASIRNAKKWRTIE